MVGSADLSALFRETATREFNIAEELASEVAALARSMACTQGRARPSSRDETKTTASVTRNERARRWHNFDARLHEIQARLARRADPTLSATFQAHLISSLRCQGSMEHAGQGANGRNGRVGLGPSQGNSTGAETFKERRCEWSPLSLCVLWRLHGSGLLPLARLLEANEISPLDVGFRWSGQGRGECLEEPFEDLTDTIVLDLRELARETSEESEHLGHGQERDNEIFSPLSDIAQYLFDIGYRKLPAGLGTEVGEEQARKALSSRSAARVLDRLCCGQELFG